MTPGTGLPWKPTLGNLDRADASGSTQSNAPSGLIAIPLARPPQTVGPSTHDAGFKVQLDGIGRPQPDLHEISFEDRLALLIEHEASQRHDRKLKRLFWAAAPPDAAAVEDLDPRAQRGMARAQIASLGSCDWIRRQQNLIIQGATGGGKTWLACALAGQACRLDIPVLFYRTSEPCSTIRDRAHEGALLKLALAKPSLLVLDDPGLGEIDTLAEQVLMELVDRRQRTGSLLITSQYSTEKWHAFFADPTVADAVLDRIVHKAHRIPSKASPCARCWRRRCCRLSKTASTLRRSISALRSVSEQVLRLPESPLRRLDPVSTASDRRLRRRRRTGCSAAHASKDALVAAVAKLQTAVSVKADGAEVARRANEAEALLVAAYTVPWHRSAA